MHLLCTSSFLSWLACDSTLGLLKCALDFVRNAGLSLVMRVWCPLLGNTSTSGGLCSSGLLRGGLSGGRLALALRGSGDRRDNSRLGIAC